jgi:hypothetical protein
MPATSVPMRLRLSPTTLERLREAAAVEQRTVAGLAAIIIGEWLAARPVTARRATAIAPAQASPGAMDRALVARDIASTVGIEGSSLTVLQVTLDKLPAEIRTHQDAIQIGPEGWIQAGATQAIVRRLFPDDERAARLALQMERKRRDAKRRG